MPAISPEILQLFRSSQSSTQVASTSQSMSSAPASAQHCGLLTSKSPVTLPHTNERFLTTSTAGPPSKCPSPDQDSDPIVRKKTKKAERNAARPAHHKYRDNAQLSRVLAAASCLLKVHFSTVNPFPSPREVEQAISKKFETAVAAEGLPADSYTVTKDIYNLVSSHQHLH